MAKQRWLSRARALKAAEDWRRLLGLARRARKLGLSTPEFEVLGAEAALYLGRPKLTLRLLEGVAKEASPQLTLQIAHLNGVALFELGSVEKAAQCFQELLGVAARRGDQLAEARAAQNLGAVATLKGQAAGALRWYRRAVAAYRRAGHKAGVAEVLHNLAIVCRDTGDYVHAGRYVRRAEQVARGLGDRRLAAMASALAAEINLRQSAPRVATTQALAALRLFREVGDISGEADALKTMGRCLSGCGYVAASQLCLEKAGWLAQKSGNRLLEAEIERAFHEVQA